ncbi:MAG: HutD family protein [Cyclobacteriaceae bacterium]
MTNRVTILTSNKYRPAKWSGGSTTELFIIPVTAVYKKLDFDFRLSTATIEVETSVFTPLDAISRTLMVLEGRMRLVHEGRHTAELSKNQVDRFDGSWKTTSFGTCTDFNIMTKDSTKGDQVGFSVKKDQHRDYLLEEAWDWFFIYAHAGSVDISLVGENHQLNKEDLLVIEHPENSSARITGLKTVTLFCATSSFSSIHSSFSFYETKNPLMKTEIWNTFFPRLNPFLTISLVSE